MLLNDYKNIYANLWDAAKAFTIKNKKIKKTLKKYHVNLKKMEKKKRWEKNQRKVNKTKTELFKPYWKLTSWDFLGVQWSRLHAPNAKGMSSIHSHRTKIPTCCTVWPKMGKNSPLTKQIQKKEKAAKTVLEIKKTAIMDTHLSQYLQGTGSRTHVNTKIHRSSSPSYKTVLNPLFSWMQISCIQWSMESIFLIFFWKVKPS